MIDEMLARLRRCTAKLENPVEVYRTDLIALIADYDEKCAEVERLNGEADKDKGALSTFTAAYYGPGPYRRDRLNAATEEARQILHRSTP